MGWTGKLSQKAAQQPEQASSQPAAFAVQVRSLGANPNAVASGREPLPGKANYLVGNNRATPSTTTG